MFTIKENVLFDSLPKQTQDILRRIGFKNGDIISKICQDTLDRKHVKLEHYFFENQKDENL